MATDTATKKKSQNDIDTLFSVGAQYGYSRSRRHPSTGKYIFSVKNNVEIFDLEKTKAKLEEALAFVKKLGAEGKTMLLLSGKPESRTAMLAAHEKTDLPYVIGRWIGGTLTNFEVIRKRVDRLTDIRKKQEKGGLEKYTKKERLLMRREAERLENMFGGIVAMEKLPGALFVVDPEHEHTALNEAVQLGIPVVALASSDCDLSDVDYPIPANDSNIQSINFFVERAASAYKEGLEEKASASQKKEKKDTKDKKSE